MFVRYKDGFRISIHVNIFPIIKDGKITDTVEVFTQDSPTVYEDDLIEHLSNIAMHDTLTHLPNRRYLAQWAYSKSSVSVDITAIYAANSINTVVERADEPMYRSKKGLKLCELYVNEKPPNT